MLDFGYWMLDTGCWMLDLICHPGGIFAVAGTIVDIGWQRSISPFAGRRICPLA
ncbi:MAG: hypothetical protein KAV45_03490 [Calditrichia bacterium]|nr:hypothetical protein [Calditrichia bacterium]